MQKDLVVIEEPEAHLHPSMHGAIADLVISCSEKSQVLIETHSENFILRLRRRIAEGALDPARLALVYVDEAHLARAINILETGETSDWPTGVFEYDVVEAEAIVQARLNAMPKA